MLFLTLGHTEKDDLRAVLAIENDAGLPTLRHFYLETREGKEWKRSRKIKREWFSKYMKRFGFDEIEANFLMEEAAMKDEE